LRFGGTTVESFRGLTLEDGLRALREATELAKSIRTEVDDEYMRLIALVEALPQNQSGTDKTSVERSYKTALEHYQRAKRA
jgi:hypothetical protein